MAESYTTRLGLYKAVKGDAAGTWATGFGTGQDNAEARFLKVGAGNPNSGAVEVNFVGQRYYDSTDGYEWVGTTLGTPPTGIWSPARIMRGSIDGFGITREDANDARFELGEAACQGNQRRMVSGSLLTKQSDFTWAAGDDAGGFPDAGSVAADTWYHMHSIMHPKTGLLDGGFDENLDASDLFADAAVIAAGYTDDTLFRRRGSILMDGSSQIVEYTQYGDLFLWKTPVIDYSNTGDFTTGVDVTLDYVPPDVRVEALLRVAVSGLGAGRAFIVMPKDEDSVVPDNANAPLATFLGPGVYECRIRTNTSQQIHVRNEYTTSIAVKILVKGYIDSRGKDA